MNVDKLNPETKLLTHGPFAPTSLPDLTATIAGPFPSLYILTYKNGTEKLTSN